MAQVRIYSRHDVEASNVVLDYDISMRSLRGVENRGVYLASKNYSTSGIDISLSRCVQLLDYFIHRAGKN